MTSNDRDRRDDGRPEQARQRDRTGRPLPHDAPDGPRAEDHDPETVEEALELGVQLWNEGRFFEAHECLEAVWHAAPAWDTDLWQGVIQLAVAGVHLQRGNPVGALALLDRALQRLDAYPALHRGIDVAGTRRTCRDLTDRISREGAGPDIRPGHFPAGPRGPWFTSDPSALAPPEVPTPVPDEPAWLAAGRRRTPRTR